MTAVSIKDLGKNFGTTKALDRINLDIDEGEIFGLVGPDGAGKTTLIRLLCGVLTPTAGDAVVLGNSVKQNPEDVKENIGYMSQRFSLYQDLSVEENIKFFQDLYKVAPDKRQHRMEQLLDFSKLGPFRDRPAGKLSGGMKQKLGLCCALIHTPKILFLDEPTTGVDPISRRELWGLLYELWSEGMTIIVSTPYMDEAERCTMIGFIEAGNIIATGTPAQISRTHPYQIAEISNIIPQTASSALSKLSEVVDVHHFGDRLHLSLDSYDNSIDSISTTLHSLGMSDFQIRQIKPSLEDVFLELGGED